MQQTTIARSPRGGMYYEAFEVGMAVRRDMFGAAGAAQRLAAATDFNRPFEELVGATVEEIREVLLHTAIYAGIPAGVEAFTAAAEVLPAENR